VNASQGPTSKLATTLRLGLAALSLFACAVAVVYLGSELRNQIDALATANTDNRQWSLVQGEVELLAFKDAVDTAERAPEAPVTDARRRFDIFYSRVQLYASAPQFQSLRDREAAVPELQTLATFLDEVAGFVDAGDQPFRANLTLIRERTDEVRPVVRRLMLEGLSVATDETEQRRTELAATLVRLGSVLMVVVSMLLISVVVLLRLLQIGRDQDRAQQITDERLAAIASTSLDAIIVADKAGRVIDYNTAAERTFGYSRDEAMGAKLSDLIVPPAYVEAHEIGMTRYLSTGQRRMIGKGRVRLETRDKTGRVFPVEVSISTARSDEGEIFVSFLRDISAQVKAEQDLIEARDSAVSGEKAKAKLLAVMSHEMRTPLNGVLGALDLIGGTEITAEQLEYLDIMRASGNLLLSHVNNVLEISRLDSGQTEVANMPFDLGALLSELCASQRAVAQNRGISIVADFDAETVGLVAGDPARIRQILSNLLGNAVKFTKLGEIRVEAERISTSDLIELRVADTGIGIAQEHIDRIFDDFITLNTDYNRDADGTGLGLGIVRRQVEAMGGSIGVESELGQGSLFWVRLPLPRSTSALPTLEWQRVSPAPTVKRCLDVLVVEDNLVNRRLARDMLEGLGHRVTDAEDGAKGVEAAQNHKFDLIFMDISMPRLDGATAARLIIGGSGPNARTPIVAATAHAMPAEIDSFAEAGMVSTILKPISRRSLSDVIETLFGAGSLSTTSAKPHSVGLISCDQIRELRQDIGADNFDSLFEKFRSEVATELAALTALDARSDLAGWVKNIHRLTGSTATFGAIGLRDRLAKMESAAKRGDAAAAATHLPLLKPLWQQTLVEFDLLLAE